MYASSSNVVMCTPVFGAPDLAGATSIKEKSQPFTLRALCDFPENHRSEVPGLIFLTFYP